MDIDYGFKDYRYWFSIHALAPIEKPFVVEIKTSTGHRLIVDEPEEYGGSNRGPNPIELFLASIASCFAISLLIHAKRRKVSIERIEVSIRGEFDIRGFLAIEGFESGLKDIVMSIEIESSSSCRDVEEVLKKTLRGWVVGSTIARTGILRIEKKIMCRD